VKLGCCACAGGTAACPYDVDPPELLPPPELLLVGEAHGSLGVGAELLVGSGAAVSVGVGVAAPAWRWSAPADGLRLSSGTGREDEDAVGDDEPEGDALDPTAQSALVTGSGEDELDGEALADCSAGTADGLSDGRSELLGPPPSPAKAVAATDAKRATVAAPRAAVLRDMSTPPSTLPSPEALVEKPAKRLKPPGHAA